MNRWNTLKGAWQSYSMRGWYQSVLNGVLGVRADAGGITIVPGVEGEWAISGHSSPGSPVRDREEGLGTFRRPPGDRRAFG